MKEWISKYQKAIVGTGAVSVLLICFLQQRELSKLRSESKPQAIVGGDIKNGDVIDSLRNEIFIKETIIQRYEIALEMLEEVNPEAAQSYESILSTKTE